VGGPFAFGKRGISQSFTPDTAVKISRSVGDPYHGILRRRAKWPFENQSREEAATLKLQLQAKGDLLPRSREYRLGH
jgi:hypothetical protein